jgi:hypothetical protein
VGAPNRDQIARLVGEALSLDIAVLNGGEERACVEAETIGILMVLSMGRSQQLFERAADLRDTVRALETVAVLPSTVTVTSSLGSASRVKVSNAVARSRTLP